MTDPARPFAYLVGRYPAASHAFLLTQVAALRKRGARPETITIRSPLRGDLRDEADREAARTTYRVLPAGPLKLAASHIPAFLASPRRYFGTLRYALGLSRGGLRPKIWQLFYFAEAMVVRRRCRKLGITHLHAQFADTATDSALLATHYEPTWTWSIAVHGPDEFAEAAHNRIGEKLARADAVIAASEGAAARARTLMELGAADKLSVVRLGVDAERFSPANAERGALTTHTEEKAPQNVRVLSLGRLVERKGQRILVAAAVRLAERGVDFELTIAGDGPTRPSLEKLVADLGIADRVTFTGVVGQDEAVELYRDADVFALPSLAEGLPVVLMEAMATGLPVISTRIDAIPELIDDGVSGLFVEAGDAQGLTDALITLAGDAELRGRLGAAGREKVLAEFELGRQAERLLAVLPPGLTPKGLPGEAGEVRELPDAE
jgi:glycosyltransferase involved in cell wall biosynthesis